MSHYGHEELACYVRAALASFQGDALIDLQAIESICGSQAGTLPAALTGLFGFECRLGEMPTAADFLLRTAVDADERRAFLAIADRKEGVVWHRLRQLAAQQFQDGSRTSKITNLWLEYDVAGKEGRIGAPSVFWGTGQWTCSSDTSRAAELIEGLRGAAVPVAVRRALNHITGCLPHHAQIFQAGVMTSRAQAPLRLCIKGVLLPAVEDFLKASRWPGVWSEVQATLSPLLGSVDAVALDLDLDDGGDLTPRLGVELYQRADAGLGEKLPRLVRQLEAHDLCLPAKAQALLAWPGVTHQRMQRDLWPPTLIASAALRPGESSAFLRWVHHVKVTTEAHKPAVAKAYLAVGHVFLSDAVLHEVLRKAEAGGETALAVNFE